MAKLKEIAEKANVSVATVSHVINGTRPVSDALRKRVLEAMAELGVEVHISPPKRDSSRLIAMVIDDIFNPFLPKFLLQQRALLAPWVIIFFFYL